MSAPAPAATPGATWTPICRYTQLPVDRAVAALLDGAPVAVVRLTAGQVYVLGAVDPACGAAVLPRGIVGDRAGVPVLISPMYKDAYALATGGCVAGSGRTVPVFATRTVDGVVLVGR
jgi:nitrite reductase (NADH) small subunit